jgi:hypothetical protein
MSRARAAREQPLVVGAGGEERLDLVERELQAARRNVIVRAISICGSAS